MIIVWTDPERSGGVVGFQIQPREVLVHEYVRDECILLPPVNLEGRHVCWILVASPRIGKFASQSTKVDCASSRSPGRVGWGWGNNIVLIVNFKIFVVVVSSRTFRDRLVVCDSQRGIIIV